MAVTLLATAGIGKGDEIRTLCDKGALAAGQRGSYVSNLLAQCHASVNEAFYNNRSLEGFDSYIRFKSTMEEQDIVKLLFRDRAPHPYDARSMLATNAIFLDPEEDRLMHKAMKKRLSKCDRYYTDHGHFGRMLLVEGTKGKKLVFHLYSWRYYE